MDNKSIRPYVNNAIDRLMNLFKDEDISSIHAESILCEYDLHTAIFLFLDVHIPGIELHYIATDGDSISFFKKKRIFNAYLNDPNADEFYKYCFQEEEKRVDDLLKNGEISHRITTLGFNIPESDTRETIRDKIREFITQIKVHYDAADKEGVLLKRIVQNPRFRVEFKCGQHQKKTEVTCKFSIPCKVDHERTSI